MKKNLQYGGKKKRVNTQIHFNFRRSRFFSTSPHTVGFQGFKTVLTLS